MEDVALTIDSLEDFPDDCSAGEGRMGLSGRPPSRESDAEHVTHFHTPIGARSLDLRGGDRCKHEEAVKTEALLDGCSAEDGARAESRSLVGVRSSAPLGVGPTSLYAVFDGHGGAECARWVSEHLPALLLEELATREDPNGGAGVVKEAMRRAFGRCDTQLLAQCELAGWRDGCCAIAALVDRRASPERVYVANLGDSRAFVCVVAPDAPPRAVPLSRGDHSPLAPVERKRIEASGGTVEEGRVCGVLEVSRSFGDARLKKRGVIATPDVVSFVLATEQKFVLLACDGLWRVFTGTPRPSPTTPGCAAPLGMQACLGERAHRSATCAVVVAALVTLALAIGVDPQARKRSHGFTSACVP